MKSLSTKEEKIGVKRATLSNTLAGTNNIRRFTTYKYRVRDIVIQSIINATHLS